MVAFSIDSALIVAIIGLTGSIIVAVINAAILEPKKMRDERRDQHDTRQQQLRKALYSEMAHVYCTFKTLGEENAQAHKIPRSALVLCSCFDIYDFTRNDPISFYELPDAHSIDTFYRQMRRILVPGPAMDQTKAALAKKFEDDPIARIEREIDEDGVGISWVAYVEQLLTSNEFSFDWELLKEAAGTSCLKHVARLATKVAQSRETHSAVT